MRFVIQVEVEVSRSEGKFASRDEIAEAIVSTIDDADPSTLDGVGADGDSSYEVESWSASDVSEIEKAREKETRKLVKKQGRARMTRDCMNCERTFEDDGTHDICPSCRKNPNQINV